MKKLIKRILREQLEKSDRHYRILDKISNHVQLPYFDSMEGLTIYDEDDQLYIMKKILGNDIRFEYDENGKVIFDGDSGGYDDNGNEIYEEYDDGSWVKYEYNDNGNIIYSEDSDGFWRKWEYDDRGNIIYYENSDGRWKKYEYDDNGNPKYFEDADGNWEIQKYDDRGYQIYYEDSFGKIIDNR